MLFGFCARIDLTSSPSLASKLLAVSTSLRIASEIEDVTYVAIVKGMIKAASPIPTLR